MSNLANKIATMFNQSLALYDGERESLNKKIRCWVEMLANVGAARPKAEAALIFNASEPFPAYMECGAVLWHVRVPVEPTTAFFVKVVGLERGWFTYDRNGFLVWTDYGRTIRASDPASGIMEEADGQLGLAF